MIAVFNIVRLSIIIFSILSLTIFCYPMLIGIFNIGNLTGSILSLILITSSLGYSKLKNLIIQLYQHPILKIILLTLSLITMIIIICVLVLSMLMVKAATNTPPTNATVVVLGCKVNGENPSLMLTRRLETAFEYLDNNKNTICIVSGGQGNGENIAEAQAMYKYLIDKGIENNRMYKEDKSANTNENIEFSKKIIEQNHLNEDIAIVTDGFHQLRANIISKNNGLKAYSISANTPWYTIPTYYIRELYALTQQIVLK